MRALAFLLALLAPLTSSAGDDVEKFRSIVDGTILPLMSRYDRPRHGGGADGRRPVPCLQLRRVVKAATLAAYAQATGKLSLDEHPGRYLPRLKGRPIDDATLLELGTYTAGGLPLQFPDAVTNDQAVMAYFQSWKADALPGTVRRYSNPSLGLLGVVTAVALNDRFATLVETQLLPKFGMRHTYVHVPAHAMADYAWGHRDGKSVRVNAGPLDGEAYGIKSTAADMIRFVQANIDPGGLEDPLRRAVEATHVGYFRVGGMVQGLGWEQFPYPLSRELLLSGNSDQVIYGSNPVQRVAPQPVAEPRLFDKTGSTGGFGAYVAFVPSKKIGLVMLANRSFPIPARVEAAYAILEQLSPGPR